MNKTQFFQAVSSFNASKKISIMESTEGKKIVLVACQGRKTAHLRICQNRATASEWKAKFERWADLFRLNSVPQIDEDSAQDENYAFSGEVDQKEAVQSTSKEEKPKVLEVNTKDSLVFIKGQKVKVEPNSIEEHVYQTTVFRKKEEERLRSIKPSGKGCLYLLQSAGWVGGVHSDIVAHYGKGDTQPRGRAFRRFAQYVAKHYA